MLMEAFDCIDVLRDGVMQWVYDMHRLRVDQLLGASLVFFVERWMGPPL